MSGDLKKETGGHRCYRRDSSSLWYIRAGNFCIISTRNTECQFCTQHLACSVSIVLGFDSANVSVFTKWKLGHKGRGNLSKQSVGRQAVVCKPIRLSLVKSITSCRNISAIMATATNFVDISPQKRPCRTLNTNTSFYRRGNKTLGRIWWLTDGRNLFSDTVFPS